MKKTAIQPTPQNTDAPAPRNHWQLAGSALPWRRPYVMAASVAFNVLYQLCRRNVTERADEVAFISRQTDEPRYDFAMLAQEFQSRGWRTTMHLQKVKARNLPRYAAHVLTEIQLLGRCKVVVLDRYDPVVSLINFECDDEAARAGALTPPDNDNQVGYANLAFPKSPVILQLWHAFGAFKKFGFQTVDTPEGHPSDFIRDWRIHHNYSWVVCSGEEARTAFAEAFSCPTDRVLPLNRPEYDELVALRSSNSLAENPQRRLRVLMAPTLRKSTEVPHPMRDLYALHDAFESFLDADVVWAFHPLEEGLPAPGDVSGELLDCDVVVTDYSSLVYEASLLGKMALFYVPDIESYRITPGLNRDPLLLAPDLCARDEGELVVRLQNLIANPANYPEDQLQRFIGRAFTAPQQGTVAAQIVDFLIACHLP